MQFYRALARLRSAAFDKERGGPANTVVVHRNDLRELIEHFDCLDTEARERHYTEHREYYPSPEPAPQEPQAPQGERLGTCRASGVPHKKGAIPEKWMGMHWCHDWTPLPPAPQEAD